MVAELDKIRIGRIPANSSTSWLHVEVLVENEVDKVHDGSRILIWRGI